MWKKILSTPRFMSRSFSSSLLVVVATCAAGSFPVAAWAQVGGANDQGLGDQASIAGANPTLANPDVSSVAGSSQRGAREKLAPLVMSPQASAEALQAAHALELAVFGENAKRLRLVEGSDPARALAEYRRFLGRTTLTPVVGVQVALKISQLRLKLGDAAGALMTCEVMAKKYAAELTCSRKVIPF